MPEGWFLDAGHLLLLPLRNVSRGTLDVRGHPVGMGMPSTLPLGLSIGHIYTMQ